jgi:hypothetical protein
LNSFFPNVYKPSSTSPNPKVKPKISSYNNVNNNITYSAKGG